MWMWWRTHWNPSEHSKVCQDLPPTSCRTWVLFCHQMKTNPPSDQMFESGEDFNNWTWAKCVHVSVFKVLDFSSYRVFLWKCLTTVYIHCPSCSLSLYLCPSLCLFFCLVHLAYRQSRLISVSVTLFLCRKLQAGEHSSDIRPESRECSLN